MQPPSLPLEPTPNDSSSMNDLPSSQNAQPGEGCQTLALSSKSTPLYPLGCLVFASLMWMYIRRSFVSE
jgi:hypothetical protein